MEMASGRVFSELGDPDYPELRDLQRPGHPGQLHRHRPAHGSQRLLYLHASGVLHADRRAIALFFMSFPPNLLFSVFLAAVSPRELPLNAAGSRALHNLFMKDHV